MKTIQIKDFSLAWRWTDSKYSQFSEEDLNQIKPLEATATKQHYNKVFTLLEKNNFIPSKDIFNIIENIQNLKFNEIQKWLKDRIKSNEVILSWDENTAIRINANLFIEKWDDFCYPSSDDIIISSKNTDEIILYQHCEIFWYGKI